MENKEDKVIYRATQFCKMLGIDRVTMYKYQKLGLLPQRKNPANNQFIFYLEDLEDFKLKVKEYNEKSA